MGRSKRVMLDQPGEWEKTSTPGRKRRVIATVNKGRTRQFEYKDFCCDCLEENMAFPGMVKTEFWVKAFPSYKGRICVPCLEKRLGHPLKEEDFVYGSPKSGLTYPELDAIYRSTGKMP